MFNGSSGGGRAFFFFFSPGQSTGYQDPLFLHFCNACAKVRKQYPNLTGSACRTLLSIVVESDQRELSYRDVAEVAGLEYIQAVHQIEMLSTGRNNKDGLGLLVRQEAKMSKFRAVTLSQRGEDFARTFAPRLEDGISSRDIATQIEYGPLPGFRVAVDNLPGIALGTLTVLLNIALKQKAFGIHGIPAKTIAEELELSNFPRHLAILGNGLGDRPGYGLINLIESAKDKRIKLPELSEEGHRVLTAIASEVVGSPVEKPRKVKPEVLDSLDSPDDMPSVSEDDYTPIKMEGRNNKG